MEWKINFLCVCTYPLLYPLFDEKSFVELPQIERLLLIRVCFSLPLVCRVGRIHIITGDFFFLCPAELDKWISK